jgi:muramoyltetrapeptide carboxypeptidase
MARLPERLREGDTVAPADPKAIDQSVQFLEARGFKVKPGRHVRKRWGYLAGRDGERAADLMAAFADTEVRGIFCVRGGYGTARLLPLLDFGVIRRNPKVFVGFSDITSLHCAFLKRCNLVTFHGPMVASYLIKPGYPGFSSGSLFRTIMEAKPAGSIVKGYKGNTVQVLRGGKAAGELVGGNLALLTALMGTPFEPSFRGKIVYLEEVDEKPYRVDRMLTQLLNAGVLQQAAGVAVGICQGCDDPKAKGAREYRQTLDDVLRDRLGGLKVPVVTGLPFGHSPHNATLPVGGRAILDANKGDLILTSAAVR